MMERFFIELIGRGLVLALLTAGALIVLRRSASAYRHLICVVALAGMVILPVAQRMMPPLRLLPSTFSPGQRTVTHSSKPVPVYSGDQLQTTLSQEPISIAPESVSNTAVRYIRSVGALNANNSGNRFLNSTIVLFTIWLLGAAALLIRLIVALLRLRRLRVESRLDTLNGVSVLISEKVRTPLTWGLGVRRSVILLPAAVYSGEPGVYESAIRHEQAHIARCDWMWNLLAEMVCALCWFQPGAWWLRSRMRLESERACDDRVLLSGVAGPDYAAHLLEILQTVCTSEVAPAMAQCGGMEERMKHILDAAKSRRAQSKWLVTSAPFVLALLSLSGLRISARPAEPNHMPNLGAITANANRLPDQPAKPTFSVEKTDTGKSADLTTIGGSLAPKLENVSWGQAVDGLEPGILPLNSKIGKSWAAVPNSQVKYSLMVRNKTKEERRFVVQCLDTDNWEIPYLIPEGLVSGVPNASRISNEFRAHWNNSPLDGLFPSYIISLEPNETVMVPGDFGLYLNDGHEETRPSMTLPWVDAVTIGVNWILHPIMVRPLTPKLLTEAKSTSTTRVIIYDRRGQASERSAPIVEAMKSGTQLCAVTRLDIELEHVTAAENAGVTAPSDHVAWGKEKNGLQLGLRLPKDVKAFSKLSQAKFEVLLRNRSNKPTVFPWMGYPTIAQFSPELFTSEGKPIRYIKTIAGPYMDQSTKLDAGEIVVLGTISLPKDEERMLDSYSANKYSAEFALGDTVQGQTKDSVKARIVFMVTGDNANAAVPSGPGSGGRQIFARLQVKVGTIDGIGAKSARKFRITHPSPQTALLAHSV